jgi:hypothetical protein
MKSHFWKHHKRRMLGWHICLKKEIIEFVIAVDWDLINFGVEQILLKFRRSPILAASLCNANTLQENPVTRIACMQKVCILSTSQETRSCTFRTWGRRSANRRPAIEEELLHLVELRPVVRRLPGCLLIESLPGQLHHELVHESTEPEGPARFAEEAIELIFEGIRKRCSNE